MTNKQPVEIGDGTFLAQISALGERWLLGDGKYYAPKLNTAHYSVFNRQLKKETTKSEKQIQSLLKLPIKE